jgi:hypothetical protein
MRHPWPQAWTRRRRTGITLAAIAVALLIASIVNVWLGWTTDEWWPLAMSALEALGALASGACAYRHLH